MLNLRRTWAACLYDLRRNTHSIKLYAMLRTLLIYCDNLSGGFENFLRQYDQHINAFGLSGFYLSDPRYTLLLLNACMVVFSNAPFIDDMQLFFYYENSETCVDCRTVLICIYNISFLSRSYEFLAMATFSRLPSVWKRVGKSA